MKVPHSALRYTHSVIRLRTQLAHAIFTDNVFADNAKAFCNESVQLLLGHHTRTVLVTARLHHPRTGGKFQPQVQLRQMVQQVNE